MDRSADPPCHSDMSRGGLGQRRLRRGGPGTGRPELKSRVEQAPARRRLGITGLSVCRLTRTRIRVRPPDARGAGPGRPGRHRALAAGAQAAPLLAAPGPAPGPAPAGDDSGSGRYRQKPGLIWTRSAAATRADQDGPGRRRPGRHPGDRPVTWPLRKRWLRV